MSSSRPDSVTVWVQQASRSSTCFLSTTRRHRKTQSPGRHLNSNEREHPDPSLLVVCEGGFTQCFAPDHPQLLT